MRRSTILVSGSAGLVALVMAFGGAAPAADAAALADLAAARDRWQRIAAADYEYAYRKFCDCTRDLPPETVVNVTDGSIVRVLHRHEDTATEVPAREGSLDLYWTIDDLFDKLASALSREALVRVQYEPRYGYPTALYVDYDMTFIGDETDLREIRVVLP
jgi:hypothetical protein